MERLAADLGIECESADGAYGHDRTFGQPSDRRAWVSRARVAGVHR